MRKHLEKLVLASLSSICIFASMQADMAFAMHSLSKRQEETKPKKGYQERQTGVNKGLALTKEYAKLLQCDRFGKITIPDGFAAIGEGAFAGRSSLKEVIISETVKSIGLGAFANCEKLKSVKIPSSVKTIGDECFKCCKSLTEATIGNNSLLGRNSLSVVGANGIVRSSITGENNIVRSSITGENNIVRSSIIGESNIYTPKSSLKIGEEVFCGCESLGFVAFPGDFETNSLWLKTTFFDCGKLNKIKYENKLGSLEYFCGYLDDKDNSD